MIVTDEQLQSAGRIPEAMVIEEILQGLNVRVFYNNPEKDYVTFVRDQNDPKNGVYSTLVAGIGKAVVTRSTWDHKVLKITKGDGVALIQRYGESGEPLLEYNMNFTDSVRNGIVKRAREYVLWLFPVEDEEVRKRECAIEFDKCMKDPEYFYEHYWIPRVEYLQDIIKEKLNNEH